jgi:hypothetical protein
MQAITLPTDVDRLDVLKALEGIPSFPRKMSCFLDYLIDYTANLNLALEQAQTELAESTNRLSPLTGSGSCSKRTASQSDYERSADLLGVDDGSLCAAIRHLIRKNRRLRAAHQSDGVDSGEELKKPSRREDVQRSE